MATESNETLHLEIATPSGLALSADVTSVTAPSVSGEFGVLPGHLPLLAGLKSGPVQYVVGQEKHRVAVGPGFAEASATKVTVVTEFFAKPEDVDAAALREEVARIEGELKAYKGDVGELDRIELEKALDWASARLAIL